MHLPPTRPIAPLAQRRPAHRKFPAETPPPRPASNAPDPHQAPHGDSAHDFLVLAAFPEIVADAR
jgi:hypothetical protein